MNKKAWLRIVEAVLASLIVLGAVLVIMSGQEKKADISDDIYERQRQILDVISKNDNLRGQVINGNNVGVNEAILKMVPSSWEFATSICGIEEICSAVTPTDKDVYVTEILITSSLTEYNPKKLRFFVWMK